MPTRKQLEELLISNPNDLFLRYAAALACAAENDPDEALQRLAAICGDQSDYVAAWLQWGQLLAKAGESEQARTVLESGIAAAIRTGDTHAEGEMRMFLDML